MILFSQLVGKQLIDRLTATQYGTICNLSIVDDRVVLHTDSTTLSASKISSIDHVVICTHCTATTGATTLLNRQCYTTKGAPNGTICDIELSSTLRAKKLHTNSLTFTVGKVVSIGDTILTRPLPPPQPAVTAPIQYGNCDWLLGRICYKCITNYNNEIIVHHGQLISRATISLCKSCYKLRELIVNSR